ncbi:MAG: hypothetical protein VX712_11385 [Bacteroidota bacterium]|nr:hypothetical protein [Bacteroidota bacterium]
MLKISSLSLSLLCFCLHQARAQDQAIYKAFDNAIGIENTVLFSGVEYLDNTQSVNAKNKFLYTGQEYVPGSLTYNKQFFPEVFLKYNVVDDRLLIQLSYQGKQSNFELVTAQVDSFTIGTHDFVRIQNENPDIQNGFFEKLLDKNGLQLFKKYRKNSRKKLDRSFTYYEYEFDTPDYFLQKGNDFFEIGGRGDVVDLFPENKTEIKEIFKQYRDLFRSNRDAFMKLLFGSIADNYKMPE